MTSLPYATFTRLKNGRVRAYLYTRDGRRRQLYANTQADAERQVQRVANIILHAHLAGLSETHYREYYLPQEYGS